MSFKRGSTVYTRHTHTHTHTCTCTHTRTRSKQRLATKQEARELDEEIESRLIDAHSRLEIQVSAGTPFPGPHSRFTYYRRPEWNVILIEIVCGLLPVFGLYGYLIGWVADQYHCILDESALYLGKSVGRAKYKQDKSNVQ